MNIYLMNEDSYQFCIKANTPKEAIDICLSNFLRDSIDDLTKNEPYTEEMETKWYFDNIFLSCSLVGELKNQ